MTHMKQLLSEIAEEHLLIPTLETRRSDSLDFHEVSVWTVDAALNAAFDAGRKSAESEDFDIHDLLAKRRQIAHVWSIEDVQQLRNDLNDEQAWEVLQQVDRHKVAELGITWLTLEMAAENLFGNAPESDEA